MDLQLDDNERKKYSFESPYPQRHFALPKNILYYISKTPSSVYGFLKLIQTCKYFFAQSKILPVEEVYQNSMDEINVILFNTDSKLFAQVFKFFPANLNRKFFIFSTLSIRSSSIPFIASALTKHIYQCCLQEISLENQCLTIDELKILFSGGQLKNAILVENIVVNADGKIAEFENVFEVIKCASLKIVFADEGHGVSDRTAAKMVEIMDSEVQPLSVDLTKIPETFNFPTFAEFMKKEMIQRKKHTFKLNYGDIVSATLSKQLQEFAKEIIKYEGLKTCSIPFTHYPRFDLYTAYLLIDMM